jgi:hypothetical protein
VCVPRAPINLRVKHAGPGHYTVPVATFGVGGDWVVRIEARVGEFDLYTGTVKVPIE